MTNYYEEYMPIVTDEEDYLKYYYEESTPLYDKLNNIIKKGQPIQRQALLKNLIIYEKETLFKSLINFIINSLPIWDIETILCFPKSLYEIITNINYIIDNDLFNVIFKHMIISLSSGFEKARNEYLFYFNKIIEYYSIIDTKNNNEIKNNYFPYKIKEEIIELIIDLGKFGQIIQNRKICCYLCSSICRIYYNNKEKEDNIKKLYQRLNYLFWDVEKTTEAQMSRELLYIIPLFYEEIFKSEDVIQALHSYINHDSDHVIQVTVIISLLKNIKYMNIKKENCIFIFNILINKIKEIIEDFDYESIYKNIILHILVNTIYINYTELNVSFLYPVFQLGIMKNYYNFYKLDILFIKNFDKYFFLINFFIENGSNLELEYKKNDKNNIICDYKILIEQIHTQINFDSYFIKIINELFLVEDNNNINIIKEDNKIEKNKENKKENKKEEIKDDLIIINNNIQNNNKEKNDINIDNIIFNDYFLDENIDIIFNTKDENIKLEKYIYNKDIIKKILYLYLPKIIGCFNNLKSNKILSEKLLFLFDKKNIEFILKVYSSSMEYILDNKEYIIKSKNKNILKKHPLYELLLLLLKKNLYIFKQHGKVIKKNNNINNIPYELNIYNKLFSTILINITSVISELNGGIKNKSLILIGKIIKLLIPKIYKYFKNITYTKVINSNDININLSSSNYKDSIKIFYYDKIYKDIFNDLISKIIINKENLGHHILKEYIEIIPLLILYSKEQKKYYNFFIKEIFASGSFYMRKYTILFYQQCFDIFSMNFLIKNNFISDFCLLLKDKVNIISNNAIELILKYNKKIISYSKEKMNDICNILYEIYDINVKAFNNKNNDIIFDKEKNIIINKIININNNINKYYKEEELNEENTKENKLINNENNIYKQHNNINNNNNNDINIINDENTKINIFQSNKHISQNNRYNLNNNNQNKNIILNSYEKPKNGKIFQFLEKPMKLFKDKNNKNLSTKCNNIFKNNFNKENKRTNGDINIRNINKRHNSMTKNLRNLNYNNTRYFLPKLQDNKKLEKENNIINNDINNVKSVDFINNNNLSSEKKIRKNSTNTKNRIPSAKIRLIDSSYPLINNPDEIKKNIDDKKNNNINNNLRYSYNNDSYNYALEDKNISNKYFSMTMRPKSKIMKLNKNSFISNKIYIDANK